MLSNFLIFKLGAGFAGKLIVNAILFSRDGRTYDLDLEFFRRFINIIIKKIHKSESHAHVRMPVSASLAQAREQARRRAERQGDRRLAGNALAHVIGAHIALGRQVDAVLGGVALAVTCEQDDGNDRQGGLKLCTQQTMKLTD